MDVSPSGGLCLIGRCLQLCNFLPLLSPHAPGARYPAGAQLAGSQQTMAILREDLEAPTCYHAALEAWFGVCLQYPNREDL
jgi:hypothetical protein